MLIPATSFAWFDKPTVEDYILQTGFIGLMIADWKQTNWIVDHPIIYHDDFYTTHEEWNPILGKHPSKKKIATYFSTCIVLHSGISYLLPKPYRTFFQLSGIAIELRVTTDNYYSGVKINW
jgi:hypothetical protein